MIGIILLVAAVVLFTILGVAGWAIGTFNVFRIGQQDIKTQWSNILAEYQRRADLFYNLAEAVKSHKNFERSTLVEVIAARSGKFGEVKATQMKKLKGLDGVFQRLMVLFERYPKLVSHKHYDKLMEEVRISEDRVNVARTDYNEIVGDYNKLVTTFPKNIIAAMFKFATEEFFKNEQGTEKAPKIKLD